MAASNIMLRSAMAAGVVALGFNASEALAQGSIKNTRHNLSSTNNVATTAAGKVANKTDATAEVCVFCHTPHGSEKSAGAPLWNKSVQTAGAYTAYTSSTLDASVDLTDSVSLACLSCHDGTQAMDTVINASGSDGYNASGARMKDGTGATATWTGSAVGAVDGKLTGVANLSKDLSNDHPVGMPYAKYGSTTNDPDFVLAQSQVKGSVTQYWVDSAGYDVTSGGTTTTYGGTATKRDKQDMILYTKGAVPYVECASCHDPHSTNATFLRIPNTGSAVCLTCHTK